MNARKHCWTTGLKPLGYRVHVLTPDGIAGQILCPKHADAMALQRAIRAALTTKGN